MTTLSRDRAELVAFLEAAVASEHDEGTKGVLLEAFENAKRFQRSASMLATLSRLVEACDDIEKGRAAELAAKAKLDEAKLRAGVNRITSESVQAYVRVRAALDKSIQTEWTGPKAVTIRKSPDLNQYLKARQDRSIAKRRPQSSSRDKRLEEIVGNLTSPEDRNDLRFALADWRKARRELALLRRAFDELGVDFAAAESRSVKAPKSHGVDIKVLKRLVSRLLSQEQLRHFGLTTDGLRVKLAFGPGTRLIEKDELSALKQLAGIDTQAG